MKSRIIIALVVVLSVIGIGFFWESLPFSSDQSQITETIASENTNEPEARPAEVLLSEEKLKAIRFTLAEVKRQKINQVRIVPGRLQYDDRKHIAIKAPTEGVLVEVLVKPGDSVKTGQILAVLNSPEIGTAGADLLQKTAEYQLVRKQ